jgi:4'-phosphopantetheinyl transferase
MLWWRNLECSTGEFDRYLSCLGSDELERVARFTDHTSRQRFVIGRATLRLLLASTLNACTEEIVLTRGVRNRPQLAGAAELDFNLSHTDAVALIGITRPGAALHIGVDVERRGRRLDADRLATKLLSAAERQSLSGLPLAERRQRFIRYWTYKEAMAKATGDALTAPFRDLELDIDVAMLSSGPPPYCPADWRLGPVSLPSAYLGAWALWKPTSNAQAPVPRI